MKRETEELLEKSQTELISVNQRIKKLDTNNSYTQQVSKHFYLGMVGGSGKNTYRLNKKREQELERSIRNAKELTYLYGRRDALTQLIADIESGDYERKILEKANRKAAGIERLIEYWNNIKAGDSIDIGGNAPVIVSKKNKKSIETRSGCKWTANQIIGKEAASKL